MCLYDKTNVFLVLLFDSFTHLFQVIIIIFLVSASNVLFKSFAAMHGKTFWWLPTSTGFEQYQNRPRLLHPQTHIDLEYDIYSTH